MLGVLRSAGLVGAPEAANPDPIEAADGELMLGLLPANVDSDGFLLHENMLAPGIFHPLLQPTWVPPTTSTTRASLFQFAIFVRIANNPLIALNPVSNREGSSLSGHSMTCDRSAWLGSDGVTCHRCFFLSDRCLRFFSYKRKKLPSLPGEHCFHRGV